MSTAIALARLVLAHVEDGCDYAFDRPFKGETCREYKTRQQGAPNPGCFKCEARELAKAILVDAQRAGRIG